MHYHQRVNRIDFPLLDYIDAINAILRAICFYRNHSEDLIGDHCATS